MDPLSIGSLARVLLPRQPLLRATRARYSVGMKRQGLAGLLLLTLALWRPIARADQDDAYGSLVGMADSASSDKGPDAGEVPADGPVSAERGLSVASAEVAPKAASGAARAVIPTRKAPAQKREIVKEDDAPVVAVPLAAAPRMWTKVFSSLLPAVVRGDSFELEVSTVARRARAEPSRSATAASLAGSAQGFLELVATASAPYGEDEPLRDAVAEKTAAPKPER